MSSPPSPSITNQAAISYDSTSHHLTDRRADYSPVATAATASTTADVATTTATTLQTPTSRERWNHPRSNVFRVMASFWSLLNLGIFDAAYGVRRSKPGGHWPSYAQSSSPTPRYQVLRLRNVTTARANFNALPASFSTISQCFPISSHSMA
ncbi:hypothetical protein LX36DRAFT_317263 [Colletotrichum falcatum]|nr:hypothetical protein LX36DRAFT_317263 [Colletotrichum falcatum]